MFYNIDELKQEILHGKSNEEIISERLKYLNSKEYKESRMPNVQKGKMIYFLDGYIDENEEISFPEDFGTPVYKMDEVDIFYQILDLFRANMIVRPSDISNIVKGYLSSDEKSIYSNVAKSIKEIGESGNDPDYAREILPCLIYEYTHANYDGSLKDFYEAFLVYNKFVTGVNINQELIEKYCKSVEGLEYDNPIVQFSSIKGTGIAQCTEYAMLTQNCLAFLGYDVYFMGGKLKREKTEDHSFNIMKTTDGKYAIVDIANEVNCCKVDTDALDVRDISNLSINNGKTILSYSIDSRVKTYLENLRRNEIQEKNNEITPNDIAKVDKETGLTTADIENCKRQINNLLDIEKEEEQVK